MTVAVVGAGAIGGLLGAHLSRSGNDVILIARGPHLAAMQANGVRVQSPEEEFVAHPRATDDIGAVAEADVVFITLKAHTISAVAPQLGASLDMHAVVVGAINGIPWWYFAEPHLDSVDPGGVIARSIPLRQVVGCVVYPSASILAPGVILHAEGNRFSLGEPDDARTERVQRIAAMLTAAGFKAAVPTRLRSEIWLKLLGNATLNPVSVLTRSTEAQMLQSEAGVELIRSLMEEVRAVATSLSVEVPLSIDKRIRSAAAAGAHKTSTLQDLEAGKSLELDALLGSVIEIAARQGVEVPRLRTLYGLAKLAERVSVRSD